MILIPKEYDFLGIDETSLNIGKGSSLVVVAETKNKNLTKDLGLVLNKSKDLLENFIKNNQEPQFPSLDELLSCGLTNYHWMRCSGGRFSRQELQHATIAHMIQVNGYKPQTTLVQIDAFYGAQDDKSKYLICEYLRKKGFNLPEKNIEIIGQADKRIPIVNYADLLAFQIGVNLGKTNEQYLDFNIGIDLNSKEEEFDEQRVMIPLDGKARDEFELIMKWYNRKDNIKKRLKTKKVK